jgi:hypothetical protein
MTYDLFIEPAPSSTYNTGEQPDHILNQAIEEVGPIYFDSVIASMSYALFCLLLGGVMVMLFLLKKCLSPKT